MQQKRPTWTWNFKTCRLYVFTEVLSSVHTHYHLQTKGWANRFKGMKGKEFKKNFCCHRHQYFLFVFILLASLHSPWPGLWQMRNWTIVISDRNSMKSCGHCRKSSTAPVYALHVSTMRSYTHILWYLLLACQKTCTTCTVHEHSKYLHFPYSAKMCQTPVVLLLICLTIHYISVCWWKF